MMFSSRSLRRPALLAIALLAPVLACSSDAPTAGAAGRLTVKLTDAPGDVVAAVVTIDQVYLQGGDSGRVVLRDEDETLDLLTLEDRTTTLIDEAQVPGGSYQSLRFVISGGYIEVENADGSTSIYASSADYAGLPEGVTVAGQLQMPSLANSGLKVQLPGAVAVEGDAQTLVVDFDVAQSFGHAAGQSGRWVMSPVLNGSRQ